MKKPKRMLGGNYLSLVVVSGGLFAIVASTPSLAQEGQQKAARRSTDPPMASRGKYVQDLFLAIDHRDTPGVKDLLARGADPNGRNGLEFSPLYVAAASYQNDVVKLLLDSGAHADSESTYGSALTFAAATGNVEGAKLLLDKGADPNIGRSDGLTVLMMAANCGSEPFVRELIDRKANVLSQTVTGATALTYAARGGHVAVGKLLLDTGLSPDRANSDMETPLMAAAMNGHADFVALLIENGAEVNKQDKFGRTPLLLAAKYGDHPEVVKALLKAGADKSVKDKDGLAAADYAVFRGHAETASLLGKASSQKKLPTAQQAAVKSMELVQSSMKTFNKGTACISCHQEGLGRMTTALAKAKGLVVDEEVAGAVQGRVSGAVGFLKGLHEQALKSPEAMKQLPLIEINEVSSGYVWMMAGMSANGVKTEGAKEMADVLAKQQTPQGFWSFSLPRIPMQSSLFTITALAVKDINDYHADGAQERTRKAVEWMQQAHAATNEDETFKLLGLAWGSADAAKVAQAATDLRAGQRPDGGWAQEKGMASDAYATGQALYALHMAGGMKVTDPAYQRGVQFLLRTQDSDGSWYVAKRAIPANNYFDGGFPHGEAQYSSFNGTCWATLALLSTLKG